jgi:hypothetical protein
MEKCSSISTQKNDNESEQNKLKINISLVLFILTVLATLILFGNLTVACFTNFTCSKFIPSPGYLGCFRGHDRVFIAGCTLSSFTLPIFYLSTFINFSNRFSEVKKKSFVILACLSSFSLPVLSLSDEVISFHYLPIEFIYRFFSSTFVVASFMILMLIMNEMQILQVSLTESEKKWYLFLKGVVVFLVVLICFDFMQWKYATSDFKGFLLNEKMQSQVEWLILFLSLFLPSFISRFFRESTLTIELKNPIQTSEFELTSILENS